MAGYDIGLKLGIDGEAEFRKNIQAVATQTKTLGTEMGSVTAQFARNASSQEALSAKTAVLNKQIDAQKEKLALQQDMLAKSTAKYGEADSRTQSWQQAVNRSTAELYKMENALADTQDGLKDVGDNLDDAGESALSFGDLLKANVIGEAIISGIKAVAGAIKDMAGEFIESAASVKAQTAQFDQTFSGVGEEASAAIERVADASGILSTRLQGTGTQIYAFAKSAGGDTEQSLGLMERALTVAADSAAYYDRSLEETAESLQSFLKGNYANDAALGLSATEATRNAAAMELFGQKFKDLTEIQKQEALLKMVEDSMALSGAMGQAQREADGWENVQGNLTESWKQFQAAVGTPVLDNLVPILQAVTSSMQSLTENADWASFTQGVDAAFEAVKSLASGDTSGITDLVSQLTGSLMEGMETLKTAIPTLLPAVLDMLSQLAGSLLSNGGSLLTSALSLIHETIAALFSDLGTMLSEDLPDMASIALELIGGLAASLRESASHITEGAVGLMEGLAQGLADSLPVLIQKVPGIVSDLAGCINDNAPKLLGAAAQMIGTIADGMIDAIPTLIQNIPQILKAIWDVFTAFQWLDLGSKIIQGVGNGIKGMSTWIKKQAGSIGDDLIGYFKGLPAKFKDIGKNLIDGLINGLTSKFETVYQNITGFISKFTGLFTSTWDIHSPSKVFASIGEYLMEGLAIGLENSKGKVMETVEDIANEVTTRFRAITDVLDTKSDISDLQYQLWELTGGKNASDAEKYSKKLEMLTEQETSQAGVVEAAQAAYQAMADQYGINSAEALEHLKTLLQEQLAYEKLAASIQEVLDKQQELGVSTGIVNSSADVSGTMTRPSGVAANSSQSGGAGYTSYSAADRGVFSATITMKTEDGRNMGSWMTRFVNEENAANPQVVSDAI